MATYEGTIVSRLIADPWVITVEDITDGHRVTFSKGSDERHIDVMNGEKGDTGETGEAGADGFSPTVTVTEITGGHRVTITDAQGAHVFDVMDGQGGGGGTSDHSQLTNRSANDQHPMSAITGLVTALEAKADAEDIPEKTSDLTNDSGFITEDDVPSALSELTDDSTHRLVTDAEKAGWNAKYSKPSEGVPKTDLASAVQTSLGLADSALQEHQSLESYRTASVQDIIDAQKVDKIDGKGLSTNDYTTVEKSKLASADYNAERNVHTHLFDGVRLNDIMSDAEFAAAIAADDWRNIKVGDYWELSLNGSYYDWGEGRLPIGHTYYSDIALTTPAGTAASELEITFVTAQYGTVTVSGTTYYVPSWDCADVIVTKGAKYYAESSFATEVGSTTRNYAGVADSSGFVSFEIDGTTYYAKPADCHGARIKTFSNAIMKYEIGGINPYWRYGDSGAITGNVPHVILIPRDCLPQTGKMRRFDKIASWEAKDVAAILNANETPNGTLKKFTFTKDASVTLPYAAQFFVDGVEIEMSNTSISSNTVTCEVATAPASGAVITCTLLNNNDVWHLTAAYHTLNDPDLGVLPLIKSALGATLAAKLYAGPNGDGMRLYTETRPGTGASSGSTAWFDRGSLFLPSETEVWGAKVYSNTQNYTFLAQLPIFVHSQRHRSKGVGNGSGRSTWWVGSVYPGATNWCDVGNGGNAYNSYARNAYGLAPSFLLTA